MAFRIHTQIDIDAPATRVWALLTDLPGYQRWNPFVIQAEGTVALGETLLVTPRDRSGRTHTFKPVVTRYEDGIAFAWTGVVLHRWIAAGEHIFELSSLDAARTRLTHDEAFTGLTRPFAARLVANATHDGFTRMNEALKREAETNSGP